MATKRRRLKNKKKNNKRRTRKVGGNPLKALDDAIGRASGKLFGDDLKAAEKKKKEEEGIELQDRAMKSDSTRNTVLLPQIYSNGVPLSDRLNKADAAAQDPVVVVNDIQPESIEDDADELNRFLDEASKYENKETGNGITNNEELVEKEKTNEAQSEPTSVDIAKIAREVSLAARKAADALRDSEVSEEEKVVSDDELMKQLSEGIEEEAKKEEELVQNINKLVDIEALGVAASNVADAIREVAIKLKPNEDEETVAPMPSVVTPPVLPNSDTESSDTESSDEESSDEESSEEESSEEESSDAKPQPQVTSPLPDAAIIDPATTKAKIKQIKEVVNPAIETLLFKSSDQLHKQVTDYKKYTELLANYHPDSTSGGQGLLAAARGVYALGKFVKKKHDNSLERKKAKHKTKMAELAKNVMENGFIIGIERPVDDETYKVYEYSNYKIFEDELEKSTEPEAKTVLADFKENEMKYRKALGKLTRNEKLRLIVDYLDRLEGDTTGGSTIIRNYAIHTMKGTVSEIIERYKGNGYIREIGIGLKREIIPILNTNKQLSNSDYIKYLALKNLFEWLKLKCVLHQYKLEGEPLFNSFGEDFIKTVFSGRAKTMKELESSIDALINKKIIAYDPGSDNGLIDNLKCYKKGKTKCNEIEYLELEKFPEQLKSLILTDENGSTAPQYKEISELAKVILADYTKKYAKKYTRKNKQSSSLNMTLKNPPPNQVIIRPKFDSAIESDLNMIGYDKDKVSFESATKLLIITINKNGVMINGERIQSKDLWNAARKNYLGYEKSPDEFELPRYADGELKFIVDLQEKKMAAYINGSKEILINNIKQLDEFKSALNSVKKSVFSFR